MKKIIAGATGFIGQALVKNWLMHGDQVVVVGRSTKKIHDTFGSQVGALSWDNFVKGDTALLEGAQVFVNLCGAGIADKRWSMKRKDEIMDSRVETTKRVVQYAIKKRDELRVLLNASAIGIYGIQETTDGGLPQGLDEESPIADENSDDFLSSICRRWEAETLPAKDENLRVVNLRIGVTLGKNGGPLPKMALPFHLFAGGPIGSGKQPIAWISLMDIVSAIDFIIEKDNISGPVNCVAPECVTQRELALALGEVLRRPSVMPTPAFALRLILGEMADELLLSGQHVKPSKLIQSGFKFEHPDILSALKAVYSRN